MLGYVAVRTVPTPLFFRAVEEVPLVLPPLLDQLWDEIPSVDAGATLLVDASQHDSDLHTPATDAFGCGGAAAVSASMSGLRPVPSM